MALLTVASLSIDYPQRRVLDGLSFELDSGRCLGLVGESGSGKSQTALALMGLLPGGAKLSGSVQFEARELLSLTPRERAKLRGDRIGLVFQDPMTSLNPYLRIGDQLAEVLIHHRGDSRAAALAESQRMLEAVQISAAARRLTEYPHELSGGMRQRVMIAMMLLLRPALLIADEPTTALDVTVQARILRLLAELRRDFGLALLMISHDLGVIADVADELLVLYGGRMMERGPVASVLAWPRHPYTRGLMASRPSLDSPLGPALPAIPGLPQFAGIKPGSCAFAARCSQADPRCQRERPPWRMLTDSQALACHHAR